MAQSQNDLKNQVAFHRQLAISALGGVMTLLFAGVISTVYWV